MKQMNYRKFLSRSYEVLFWTALFGLFGTNALTVVFSAFFAVDGQIADFRPGSLAVWYLGTAVGFLDAVFLLPRLRQDRVPRQEESPEGVDSGDRAEAAMSEAAAAKSCLARPNLLRSLADAGGVGLLGGIVGAYFGVGLLTFWFWVVASPFAPSELASSPMLRHDHGATHEIRRPLMPTSRSTIALLFGVPLLTGTTAGFVGRSLVLQRENRH